MKKYFFCAGIALALLAVLLLPKTEDETMQKLKVTVLDVGKADCIILQSQDFVFMIDTAEAEDYGKATAFLQQEKINKIDYLVITHFDKDHVGGAAQLLDDYEVLHIIEPDYEKESEARTDYEAALQRSDLTPTILSEKTVLSLGAAEFSLLPTHETYDEEEDNNYSIIVGVQGADYNLLFMGDAKKKRVEEFLEQNSSTSSTYDFIKFPAHGAYHKAIDDLLDQTQPTAVAITCSGKYPPEKKTLEALKDRAIKVCLTKNGTVQLNF